MGVELLLGLTALSGAGQIFTGIEQQKAASREADEVIRQTEGEATRKRKALDKLSARQRTQFLKSGVTLEGSPLLVLEETRREGVAEIGDIRRAGVSQAQALTNQGRSAFFRGLFGAVGTIGQGFLTAGALKNKPSNPFKIKPEEPIATGGLTADPRFAAFV